MTDVSLPAALLASILLVSILTLVIPAHSVGHPRGSREKRWEPGRDGRATRPPQKEDTESAHRGTRPPRSRLSARAGILHMPGGHYSSRGAEFLRALTL